MIYRNSSISLISIPFIFYFAFGYITAPKNIHISGKRILEFDKSIEDQENSMQIFILNQGKRIPHFEYKEQLLSGIQLRKGDTRQSGYLGTNESFTIKYKFIANRGNYFWNDIVFEFSDSFKLFNNIQRIETKVELISHPKTEPIPKLSLRPKFTLHTPGQFLSGKPGVGLNFWGVREYQPGDSTNRILWRLSSRYPERIFIKEFELEKMAEIGILIDTREKQPLYYKNKRIAEYSIQAGLSLSKSLLSDFNRVSVFLLGNNRKRIFSGIGKHQLNKIQSQLAHYEINGEQSYDAINRIPLRIFPKPSIVFIISPLQENDDSIVNRLVSEGHQVTLISPNSFYNPNSNITRSYEDYLGIRFANIERVLMLHKIKKNGVQVWDWDLDHPLSYLINLSKRELIRRKTG